MALRLRRGTDTERQLITPVEGELIYVTDTKELYAGDGNTVGGVRVTGEIADTINGLTDVDAGVPQDNDILLYSDITAKWESSPLSLRTLPDVEADAILDGQILAWNAGISAFVPANNVGGGDTTFDGDLVGSVFADDSNLVIDGETGFIYGTHFGSVNNSVTGVEIIDAINNVVKGDLIGNVNGNLRGDVAGSVFADDSSIIVDAVNGSITTQTINFSSFLNLESSLPSTESIVRVNSTDARSELVLEYSSGAALAGDNIAHGVISFKRNGTDGNVTSSFIFGGESGVLIANDPTGVYTGDKFVSIKNGQLIIGGFIPNAELDVQGNAIVSGSVTASVFNGDIIGSLFTDASTMIIDSTDGKLMVANVNMIGETGNTPATPGSVDSWLEVTVNGASKYIPLYV